MLILALAALAQAEALAEIEVARGEKPRAKTLFKLDEPDGRYELYDGWGEGKSPLLPRPAKAFGAMTREEAQRWALDVVKGSFEVDGSDLLHPTNGPDTVTRGDQKPIPMGWGLDFLQVHKGAVFYDPDEAGERAGVLAMLSDDLSFQTEGPATVRITVRRWAVLKEHGPAKKPVGEAAATAAPLKHFAKINAEKPEAEAVLFWAVKPGAAERRVPLWHVTLTAPTDGLKPNIHTYRVNAWTGAIVSSREVAIPGRLPAPPPPPRPKPK